MGARGRDAEESGGGGLHRLPSLRSELALQMIHTASAGGSEAPVAATCALAALFGDSRGAAVHFVPLDALPATTPASQPKRGRVQGGDERSGGHAAKKKKKRHKSNNQGQGSLKK